MSNPSAALAVGSILDGLQIERVLGEGTFGITYLASDPALGTRFALKEFLPRAHVFRRADGTVKAGDEKEEEIFTAGLQLFLEEGRLLAALDHPNVVKVIRYFQANGTAYFLMPYEQGQPLHKLLQEDGVFTPDQARELMLPLLDAL